jgi:hypothetical protein
MDTQAMSEQTRQSRLTTPLPASGSAWPLKPRTPNVTTATSFPASTSDLASRGLRSWNVVPLGTAIAKAQAPRGDRTPPESRGSGFTTSRAPVRRA